MHLLTLSLLVQVLQVQLSRRGPREQLEGAIRALDYTIIAPFASSLLTQRVVGISVPSLVVVININCEAFGGKESARRNNFTIITSKDSYNSTPRRCSCSKFNITF
jgi:hypothetical protein